MRKTLTTLVVASSVALGGAAIGGAVLAGPALAATATEDGTSTADAVEDVVADRVQQISDALAGLVSDGTLTQDQADEVATTLADELPGPGGPGGHGPGGHGPGGPGFGPGLGGPGGLETAAETLGLDVDELRTALEEDGATLASVAEAQGVPNEDLVDALVAAETERVQERVDAGDLTQDEADERLAELRDRVEEAVTSELPAGGPGGHGPHGGPGGPAADGEAPTPPEGAPTPEDAPSAPEDAPAAPEATQGS